jgi:hypothetical protein
MKNWKEKISKELTSLIRSEKQITYLLVEIRKKLELDNSSRIKFPTLNMYCCWVLHTEMSRKEAINFLKTINFKNKERAQKISLEAFRLEFKDFLTSLELPIYLTEDEWFQFRKYFLRIISSTPLKNKRAKGQEIKELRLVNGITDSHFVYKIVYGDGSEDEIGIIAGDYDKYTKRKVDRENRRFWRRYTMKGIGRRLDIAKQIENETEKREFEEETEVIFQQMEKEEERDNQEARDDMYINYLAGEDEWS